MLDFGPNAATGASLTNSPYHASGGSTANNRWNTLGTADSSTLLYGDNTAATGVTVDLGNSATSAISLAAQPANSANLGGGTLLGGGIYASTSVAKDGIFGTSTLRYLGVQVGGLPSGTYDIYVMSRNTNTSNAHTQTAFVSTSLTGGDFTAGGQTATQTILTTAAGADGNQSAWEQNANYTRFTVTLAAGEYLNIAVNGGGSENRGFLNAIQIMEVPEPSTALLGSLCGLFLMARRRRTA